MSQPRAGVAFERIPASPQTCCTTEKTPFEANTMTGLPLKSQTLLLLPFLLVVASCYPSKKLTVMATASLLEDVAVSCYRQSELEIVRQGMPAYLMLMDGMIEGWPDNAQLLLAAAQANSAYASAFLEDSDKATASAVMDKAKRHALKALEQKGFDQPLSSSFEEFEQRLLKLQHKAVPYLFWSAACWGGWIRLNLNSMEAQAQLPRVEMMMKRVLELDEGFYYGGPHLFMGIWFASRPKIAGGNLDTAQYHFQRAMELGQNKFLMTKIYYADLYARKKFDRDLFVATLNEVLQTPADIEPDLTLTNCVARRKAEEMLRTADDYF
jgi:hypothetical protein